MYNLTKIKSLNIGSLYTVSLYLCTSEAITPESLIAQHTKLDSSRFSELLNTHTNFHKHRSNRFGGVW